MGWDAYAVRPEVDPRTSHDDFLTPALKDVFRQASQELASLVGNGSDNLGTGTLGGLSAGIFTRASGIPDYDESSDEGWLLWSPDTVRRAHEQALWDFAWEERQSMKAYTVPPSFLEKEDRLFLTMEAQLFLRTCALHGLGIWFTW
jgi:hypothetical protein